MQGCRHRQSLPTAPRTECVAEVEGGDEYVVAAVNLGHEAGAGQVAPCAVQRRRANQLA